MGLEQCSLDTGPRTLGFTKSLIFHVFYKLFLRVGKLWIWSAELSCVENVVISLVLEALLSTGLGTMNFQNSKCVVFHWFYK